LPAPTAPSTGEDLRRRVAIEAFDYSAVSPAVVRAEGIIDRIARRLGG
jgi:hypothetical protein